MTAPRVSLRQVERRAFDLFVLAVVLILATALRLDAKLPRSGQAALSAQEALRLDAESPRSAQAAGGDSVDRVRAALEKPVSKLTLTERPPDFTVHIEKRRPMQDIFDVPPWQLPPIGWRPPAVGFDLMSIVQYVAKSVADAKRGHDERVAREEVQRAIADYCAQLTTDGPATDGLTTADWRLKNAQICSTSPAIR